jgi:hypothetical protein
MHADLLDDQFQATQEYCNAQTAFRNALQRERSSNDGSTTSVVQATLQYQRALFAIQDNMKALDEAYQIMLQRNNRQDRRLVQVFEQHIQRAKRIVQTIAPTPVVHRQGVLQAQSVSVDDMTLALSALRASIRTVKESFK